MTAAVRPANVVTLREVLTAATHGGFAVGGFAARYTPMVRAILRAAERTHSPAIVQISQKELARADITPGDMADEFYRAVCDDAVSVPVVLHLDHTRDFAVIEEAIGARFTSVMIDASDKPFNDNARTTREIVQYAHGHGVSVEAELGRIGTTDFVETDRDEEMYTDPVEAGQFAAETGADALAVSCGTAHGVYEVRQPRVDYVRLNAIRRHTAVPLVLHGGSGVPAEMMHRAIHLPGGGVSKVNLATDLELALLGALGRKERMLDAECRAVPSLDLRRALDSVEATVVDKIRNFVVSEGKAKNVTP